MDLLPRLTALLQQKLPASSPMARARFCIGLSGGRDSVALLHLFSRLLSDAVLPAGQVRALHVHHGLSPHADQWAAFCRQICARFNVPLHVARVHVARQGQGLEAAARSQRYAAFADTLNNGAADYVVLAHHADDQAETLLFNLLRGAGVQGAAAMPVLRPLAGADYPDDVPATSSMRRVQVLRPLLTRTRQEIESYLAENALDWIDDESNLDTAYTRNFLRHQVLPQIGTRFPAASRQLAHAAEHFAEAAHLLDALAEADAAQLGFDLRTDLSTGFVQAGNQPLHCAGHEWLKLSLPRQRNLLRHLLRCLGWQMPARRTLEEGLRQLRQTMLQPLCSEPQQMAGQFVLHLAEGSLQGWQGRLYLLPHQPPPPDCIDGWTGDLPLPWGGQSLVLEPVTGSGISRSRWALACQHGEIRIRTRQGGENLRLHPQRPRRPLKKLLQESALPPWQRAQLPLLFAGETLIACPGIGIDPAWQAGPDEPGWQLRLLYRPPGYCKRMTSPAK